MSNENTRVSMLGKMLVLESRDSLNNSIEYFAGPVKIQPITASVTRKIEG